MRNLEVSMGQKRKMDSDKWGAVRVKDLNSVITCRLCEGYLIDATTLVECLHCFCRACILKYFENNKYGCPTCNTFIKKKTQVCFRPDPQIQSLVYKLVPSLYAKEIQRREDFYRSTGVRASSACSDDSVIDRERDLINEQEKMISKDVGDKTLFLSPEDSISLSLEYYQAHLDGTDVKDTRYRPQTFAAFFASESRQCDDDSNVTIDDVQKASPRKNNGDCVVALRADKEDISCGGDDKVDGDEGDKGENNNNNCDKRYLRCPGAVSMKHLQKFIRMKFGLTDDHKVDIIYKGEVLPKDFSLIDVAYSFKWKRTKPIRFFYRIFVPMKIRPIKIVNTTLSTGCKQLQIVPVKHNSDVPKLPSPRSEKEKAKRAAQELTDVCAEKEDQKKELFAHLQLKSRTQVEKPAKECVFEYEEPDQEEIKKFAENRDREWALQKKLDESRKREEEEYTYHFTKKRKKSKHSKSEFNVHKKRKLHAEIASNDEDLKLKVKITNNGHKHKHHKSLSQIGDKAQSEMSSKEKLLQMRQVRHKHSTEEKVQPQVPTLKLPKDTTTTNTEKPNKVEVTEKQPPQVDNGESEKPPDVKKVKIKVPEPSSKVSESAVLPKQQTDPSNVSARIATFPDSSKIKGEKDAKKPPPTTNLTQQTDKKPQPKPDKFRFAEKFQQNKTEQPKKQVTFQKPQPKPEIKTETDMTKNKILERFTNLQQKCTFKSKQQPDKVEKRANSLSDKPKFITPHYPPGFTVSKVEQGVKRKQDDETTLQDSRPSLEITLINPPPTPGANPAQKDKPATKRPPPATIPLEKIKKSVNLKSGISIIPKLPCDNIGALDLSKSSKSPEPRNPTHRSDTSNGFGGRQLTALVRPPTAEKGNMGLSNLQMLSKVATEHSSLTKSTTTTTTGITVNKPKPQMPSLQTIRIPLPPNIGKTTNLQKIPKLNEIHKFRPTSLQIRSMRPNPNQNIRTIPNPSLLIRQQNHNRLNSQIGVQAEKTISVASTSTTSTTTSTVTTAPTATSTSGNQKEPTSVPSALTALKLMEAKMQETKEISV